MILRVPLEEFDAAVRRHLDLPFVYLSTRGELSLLTAADPAKPFLIVASARRPMEELRLEMEARGLSVLRGEWRSADADTLLEDSEPDPYVVAVSYKSRETQPGVWVDAFPHEPSQAEALRAIYEDFATTGELGEVTFEEFVRLAEPNVVVVTPDQWREYLKSKAAPDL